MIRAFRHRRCAGPRAAFLFTLALAAIWAPLAPRAAAWTLAPAEAIMFCLGGHLSNVEQPNETALDIEATPCPQHGLSNLAPPPSAPGLAPPTAISARIAAQLAPATAISAPSRAAWPRAPPPGAV